MKKEDYSKYNSTAGLSTRSWGPGGWSFLFSCIMGGYPPVINKNNNEHKRIKKHFKQMFNNLGYTMPCIFCRESFKQFYKEIDIEPFLTDRINLMKWLYLIRDKVNTKLISQEEKCYNDEKKRLKKLYHSKKESDNIRESKKEYYKLLKDFKVETFITKPSPPFEEVLDKYESLRAVCSKRAKTCSLPKKT